MARRRRNRRAGGVRSPAAAGAAVAQPSPPSPPTEAQSLRPGARHVVSSRRRTPERHAALDLGTNNCRLLIAAPQKDGFRIVDAFSRIVRLGEGLAASGALSEAAMARALEALKVCAEKIERRGATRIRCIATQACRSASNGQEFLDRAAAETGLKFEVITPQEEARLAVDGCADLIDPSTRAALIFDIGGGSTELSWVRPAATGRRRAEIIAWHSIPIGVVNLSERYGGRELSAESYTAIVRAIRDEIAAFGDPASLASLFAAGEAHLLGTSGTVTSIAGVHLALPRYRRDAVDGLWLSDGEVRSVSDRLRAMSFDERAAEPCIGQDRADLVVCGCAILEAVLAEWPAARIRVADRGLREGVLAGLARGRRRRRRRKSPGVGPFDSKTHSL